MNAQKSLSQIHFISFLIIGNVLEWYGFTVGVNIFLQIAPIFFPAHTSLSVQVLFNTLFFAAAFILRPIGGLFFGHFGDRVGRVNVLWLSIVVMFIPTFLIGLVPSYQTIGYGSIVLLLFLRFMQGLSVGGEFPASITHVVEKAPPKLRGVYGSIPFVGAFLGMLLAELMHLLFVAVFTRTQFLDWAWRLPFLFSFVLAIIGVALRYNVSESEQFILIKKTNAISRIPISTAFRHNSLDMLKMFFLVGISAVTIYLLIVYMATYYASVSQSNGFSMLNMTVYSLISLTVFTPILAWFSDRLGRRPVMLCGCIGLIIEAFPLFFLFDSASLTQIIVAEIILGILGACVVGPLSAVLAENFNTRVRNTAIGFSYNCSFLIFAGLAPLIAEGLKVLFHMPQAPGLYVILVAVIAIIVTLNIKETQAQPLTE